MKWWLRDKQKEYEIQLPFQKSKGLFPTVDSAFKVMYLSIQEVQNKWRSSRVRNWSEIYPQLCIFFSEIMEIYTK